MTLVLALTAFSLLSAALAPDAPAPAASPAAAPRIVVEPASFDFGAIKPAHVVEKEFVLRNNGRADLRIDSIVSSCHCAAILADTKLLVKPGASTTFRVRLTTPEPAGRLQRSVLVKSNDPAQPTLEVKIEALVVAPRREKD
ncbi:MAG TPA: DUF1573 domain-containing protein [Vicinamibacteria bacterium]|nr:DUF1573 domain-containing protein [Vicinamibacteria bacterium]